ncbi:unnamed protein product [Thelazia callipaeda]|uniref:Glycogen [starch] synthase n=1 Tax=Thelazia callipaeda TaxID=103827 RepID=A0A0N5CTY6_THECL|nr:unnamed protein product [Thelazia callipaeda]
MPSNTGPEEEQYMFNDESYKSDVCKKLVEFYLGGIGLINAKLWKLDVALIYTTHATLLGRHLAAGGIDLYNNIDRFNLDEEAGKRNVGLQTKI